MDRETAKAINTLSKRMNDIQYRLDQFMQMLNTKTNANVDYLAMMTDVELDEESDKEATDAQ